MFMNHIKNIGWIKSLIFNKSGIYHNIVKAFGKFRIETIEKDYQDLKISSQPTDNIKNSNSAASTLGFSTQAKDRLNISLPKKAKTIIDPDLWPGSYLPQIFYAASKKEFVVPKT